MSPDLESAMRWMRFEAIKLCVRTEKDSLAMTVGNMMILLHHERGPDGTREACQRLLNELLVGPEADKERMRMAARRILQLL